MTIMIRTKTLKTFAGFLGACLVFFGGYQLKEQFNPATAMRHVYVAKADPEVINTPEIPSGSMLPEIPASLEVTPQPEVGQRSPSEAVDLAEYRLDRALARSQALQLLEEISQDPEASEAERQKARADRLAKVRQMETEVECEGALTAKGFQDVLVTLSAQQVTILMSVSTLAPEELLQISDVVCRVTGCLEEDIIVIPN